MCKRKVIRGYKRWAQEIAGVKSIKILVGNIDETFWTDKWSLHEGYGGPNLGEKGFQLFQLFVDRYYNI